MKFKKGTSGNPKGRPPTAPIIKEFKEYINTQQGSDDMDEIIKALIKQAKNGNIKAIEIILDRLYGKPKDTGVLVTNVTKMNINPIQWVSTD